MIDLQNTETPVGSSRISPPDSGTLGIKEPKIKELRKISGMYRIGQLSQKLARSSTFCYEGNNDR